MLVRDEVRMVKKTLQGLYDSSIAYGMKKALVAEQGKADMHTKIKLLEKENKELEKQSAEMEERIEFIQEQANKELEGLKESHKEVVAEIKLAVVKLKFDLDKCLSTRIN